MHAQVDRGQAVGPQGAQILLDAGPQVVGLLRRKPCPVVITTRADLADQGQIGGVGVQGLVDEFVGDVGAVELRGVDVVDAQFDGPAQHGERLVAVARRAEHAGTGQLHGAETDASDME